EALLFLARALPEFPLFSVSLPRTASPPLLRSPPSPRRRSTSLSFVSCLRRRSLSRLPSLISCLRGSSSPSISSISSPSVSFFLAVRLLVFSFGVYSQLPTVISNQ
uniref:Uncharacterized protein n=1 Tax=Cucumis melo TaxID=3656 RepID=A0A9I9EAA0_CUCME